MRAAFPATVLGLIVSDVVGDDLDVIASGPTVPDPSTFADCLRVVEHYGLRWKMPQSIWAHIEGGLQGRTPETPKADEPAFGRVRNVLVASVKQALEAAADEAARCGFVPRILTTAMSGEARRTAAQLVAEARRAQAGLRPGDAFLVIDGDSVAKSPSSEVSKKLRGQAGTDVKVTVRRPYVEDSILDFTITREKIDVDPVPYYGVARDGIGYIQITTFNDKTFSQTRDALLDLKKTPGVKSIVLDLRNNGGGLLESAVQVVGLFVPKGTEVLRTRGKGLLNEKIYKTTHQPVDNEIPLAVLVNSGSASSAEIVTGALQDLDRAVIVGERSFGKGLVQSTKQLPYNGMLKVTIAKYYIPSGRLILSLIHI